VPDSTAAPSEPDASGAALSLCASGLPPPLLACPEQAITKMTGAKRVIAIVVRTTPQP
jgi:hypothetical protein